MDDLAPLSRLQARQYGLASAAQLAALGVTRWEVRRRLERHEWVRLRSGVFAPAAMPACLEQALLAVSLSVPEAVISHDSAATLWGFRKISAEGIEISSPLPRRVDLDGVVGHRSCLLFDEDLTRHRHIPITSRARTLVDLSGRYSAAELGPILDDQLRHGLRLDLVRRCIGRLPPAPGRRPSVIHELLARRLPGFDPGDTDFETQVLRWLVEDGLPVPRQQHRVRLNGRTYKLDLAYPDELVDIEHDGWDTHRTRTAFDNDRARISALTAAGWAVLVFTSRSTREEVVRLVTTARARFGGSRAA